MRSQTIPFAETRFCCKRSDKNLVSTGHLSLVIDHWSLIIVFILSLLLILTGCGESTPTSVSIPPSPIPTPIPPTAIPTPTRESQPIIVTLGLWLPEELNPYGERPGADILAQQLEDFSEAYPDVQVEVIVKKAHGRGGLLDFLRTARNAVPSVLPDLVVLNAADLRTAAGSNLIQPLDQLLSPAEMADRFPFATELGTVNEQTVGFVIGADMQHLAYRPALFDSPPISWTQVVSAPASFLFPADGRDRQVNDATLIQYLAAGGKLTDADSSPWLDQEVMVNVLSFYSDCIGTAVISPTIVLDATDPDQTWERFQSGEGGMAVVRAGRYWLEADETVAFTSIPTQAGQPFSVARGWAIAMVTDDPARQGLAMLLLDWLIAPDHNGQWTQAAGYLPGTRNALRVWSISEADRAVLRDMMEAAVPPPRPDVMATVGPAMQEALEAMLRRRATPEEAAAAAVEILGR
jgi:ABC-type glycerol-3-phosphate transport system substrate-binding protein